MRRSAEWNGEPIAMRLPQEKSAANAARKNATSCGEDSGPVLGMINLTVHNY
jgi:hypothetical protein